MSLGSTKSLRKSHRAFISKPRTLYPSLAPEGRKIIFGFSYVQRIGQGAHTQVWFPPALEEAVGERLLQGDQSVLDEFRVDWAAVRQFELLQEASNGKTMPMEVSNARLAFKMMRSMRAGGMRVTVITMGRYESGSAHDDLQILDHRLQKTIADFISMLFLEEQSAKTSAEFAQLASLGKWSLAEALPHIAITLGAAPLFKPTKSLQAETRFFQLLELLPSQKIRHDVAIGLQIPEFTSQHQWIYLSPMEAKFYAFQTALSTVFKGFDGLSLQELSGRAGIGAGTDRVMATIAHMRGYGDHMHALRRDHIVHSANFARAHSQPTYNAA